MECFRLNFTTATFAKVVKDFEAAGSHHLSLTIGDIVQVTEKTSNVWWEGTCNKRSGTFSASCVKVSVCVPLELLKFDLVEFLNANPTTMFKAEDIISLYCKCQDMSDEEAIETLLLLNGTNPSTSHSTPERSKRFPEAESPKRTPKRAPNSTTPESKTPRWRGR